MCILMFVEKASKCALKLHGKLAFENVKILRSQNRAVAACFTIIFWHTQDLHHSNGGLTCNINCAISLVPEPMQIHTRKMLV